MRKSTKIIVIASAVLFSIIGAIPSAIVCAVAGFYVGLTGWPKGVFQNCRKIINPEQPSR